MHTYYIYTFDIIRMVHLYIWMPNHGWIQHLLTMARMISDVPSLFELPYFGGMNIHNITRDLVTRFHQF